MKSENEITTIGTSEVEVIKHCIYEVRGDELEIANCDFKFKIP